MTLDYHDNNTTEIELEERRKERIKKRKKKKEAEISDEAFQVVEKFSNCHTKIVGTQIFYDFSSSIRK